MEIEFYRYQEEPVSTSGLGFGKLAHFREAALAEGDFVFIPGMDQNYVRSTAFKAEAELFNWLQECQRNRISVCSVCNGAFALGEAGLLTGTECTTHWRRVNELQLRFPQATVLEDILYVKNKYVCTSGGISDGIDLALSILEELAGARFTNKVARGLVVYHRRNGKQKQETTLGRWAEDVGWEKLVNRASLTWRGLPVSRKCPSSVDDWLALIAEYPALIKRPVVVGQDGGQVGFSENRFTERFGAV